MQQQNSGMSCQLGSWALAAGVGLLITVLLLVLGDTSLLGSIFLGGVAFVILGVLFSWLFCRDLPEARGPGNIDTSNAAQTSAPAPKASAPSAAAPSAPAPASAPAPVATEASTPASAAASSGATDAASDGSADAAAPASSGASTTASADASAAVKPSTQLPGQDDLAARKGEWKYEGDAGAKPAAAATAAAATGAAATGAAASAEDAAQATAADASGSAKDAETKASEAGAAGAGSATGSADYDGDGALEGENEGTKPETLSAAREGGPDNLKEIKGVGPKLEQLLHSMGFFHFDQIAAWTADEVAWVNANLKGFKGRVTRDNWVEQAKILAAGGETEFSKRVDKGGVY